MEHQASAMLSILRRYGWHTFSIITSRIGGYDLFVRALRDQIIAIEDFRYMCCVVCLFTFCSVFVLFSFKILDIVTIQKETRQSIYDEIKFLTQSEARVMLLYSTRREAQELLAAAEMLNMTGKNYIWIVTQSVLARGAGLAPGEFPPGMLGVHFNTTHEKLLEEIDRAVTVFGHGLELLVSNNNIIDLNNNVSCNASESVPWKIGEILFK